MNTDKQAQNSEELRSNKHQISNTQSKSKPKKSREVPPLLKSVVAQLKHINTYMNISPIAKRSKTEKRKIDRLINIDPYNSEEPEVQLKFSEMEGLHDFLIKNQCVGFLRQPSLIDELLHKELHIVTGGFNSGRGADASHFDVNAVIELTSELASRGNQRRHQVVQDNLTNFSDLRADHHHPIIMVGSPRASIISEELCCRLLNLGRKDNNPVQNLVAPFYFYWHLKNDGRNPEPSRLQLSFDRAKELFDNTEENRYGFVLVNPLTEDEKASGKPPRYNYHVIKHTMTGGSWETFGVILAGYLPKVQTQDDYEYVGNSKGEDRHKTPGQLCVVLCGADGPATEACARMLPQLKINFSNRDGSEVLIFPIKAKVTLRYGQRLVESEDYLANPFQYTTPD